jgi:hypothetical protein
VATCGGACAWGACELVTFHEARHSGPESDRMCALRLQVSFARKVSHMKSDVAAVGHTLNQAL